MGGLILAGFSCDQVQMNRFLSSEKKIPVSPKSTLAIQHCYSSTGFMFHQARIEKNVTAEEECREEEAAEEEQEEKQEEWKEEEEEEECISVATLD